MTAASLHRKTRWLSRSTALRASEMFGKKRKLDSRPLTLVITRDHVGMGAELLEALPASPLLNPPGRGLQGASKLDCVTVWMLYRLSSIGIRMLIRGKRKTLTLPQIERRLCHLSQQRCIVGRKSFLANRRSPG